jgi:hypothetical protein
LTRPGGARTVVVGGSDREVAVDSDTPAHPYSSTRASLVEVSHRAPEAHARRLARGPPRDGRSVVAGAGAAGAGAVAAAPRSVLLSAVLSAVVALLGWVRVQDRRSAWRFGPETSGSPDSRPESGPGRATIPRQRRPVDDADDWAAGR